MRTDERYREFPDGFFARTDESDDRGFYDSPRIVTHIDDRAIVAVGLVYEQLALNGRVLDLMSSWISHFRQPPEQLVALGMNGPELQANEMADAAVVADLNQQPSLPFASGSFDAVVCCVSVDYLTQPIEVFDEAARVLSEGGTFCCTFSNRCFPTKVIAGWLGGDDRSHVELVARYFALSGSWTDITAGVAIEPGPGGDPLYAVYATVAPDESSSSTR